MAAISPVGRAAGLEPIGLHAGAQAAGLLYEHHSRRVFAYCLSKLGRREDAEDAAQTTFLHAVRGLRRGVVPSVELAWLLGIARNVCLSRRESAGRRGRLELVCDPVDLERAAARQGRSDELIGLDDALAQLPEQQRRAVLLRDWRGLSYEEVAAQLGVSLANAETLIFRGRRALAGLLREEQAAIRRRLASLGNAGSLLAWAKSALTGASAATKVASVVSAAVVSGSVIAAGAPTSQPGGGAPPQQRADATVLRSPAPPTQPPRRSSAGPAPAAAAPARLGPARFTPAARPTATPAAAPVPAPTAETPPPATATSTERPAPVAVATEPRPAAGVVPALQDVAAGSLRAPRLPAVVETVVDAVPPVSATLPPAVPVQPATIDPATIAPGALLP